MEDGVRHNKRNRLAGGLEMLTSIVNLRFPDEVTSAALPKLDDFTDEQYEEWRRSGTLPETPHIVTRPNGKKELVAVEVIEPEAFLTRVRTITIKFWPQLWDNEPDQEPPLQTIRLMRHYLRRFWVTLDDWYIYRARECHQRRRVFRETRALRELARNAKTKEEAMRLMSELDWHTQKSLDEPPESTDFERALFELRKKAKHPSTRPMKCKNEHCIGQLYFLKGKTQRKYCSTACSDATHRAKKLKSYHENKSKWPSTANRSKNRG